MMKNYLKKYATLAKIGLVLWLLFLPATQMLLADTNTTQAVKGERKTFTVAASMESPFMSIYFPLPSFAAAGFFNVYDFQIGVKAGSSTPWILGHIGNGDQLKIWYIPLYYLEPVEIRYILLGKIVLGGSLGYRHTIGTKGELSPALEKQKDAALNPDGLYGFTIKEWYGKAYVGVGLEGNPADTHGVTLEVGGIWSFSRSEEYQYEVKQTGARADALRAANFEAHLAENLPSFRDSVHKNVFPFQYIYISLRYNFSGL